MRRSPPTIPWLAHRILRFLYSQDYYLEKSGDLEEAYADMVKESGFLRAWTWFWFQIIKLCFMVFRVSMVWRLIMLKNYMTTTLRNIRKQKIYSFINLFGLALGMSFFILVMLYVNYELSFDRFHKNGKNIYRVVVQHSGSFMGTNKWVWTPDILAPTLKNNLPEIANTARLEDLRDAALSYRDNHYTESRFYLVDPSFLKIFSFKLLKGDQDTALDKPFSLLITENMAEKYFGRENPLGKIIKLNGMLDFEITGVLKNIPNNSHLRFDFLGSFAALKTIFGENYMNRWNSSNYQTYIQLRDDANASEVENKITECVARNNERSRAEYLLQPLRSIHLSGTIPGELDKNSETKYVYVFSVIGILIILIASCNYMNLATARSIKRVREVGVRKVIGATRKQLIKQFIGESIIFSLIAFLLSLLLVYLFLPVFASVLNRSFSFSNIFDPPIFFTLMAVTILIGFLSGCYPAFYISRFEPQRIIKGDYRSGSKRSLLFRNALVLVQFFISIGLIISTIIINQQFAFIRNKDIGFDKEQIISIKINQHNKNLKDKIEVFKQELTKNPGVMAASTSNWPPTNIRAGDTPNWEGQIEDDRRLFHNLYTDYDFIDLYGIEVIKGRNFSRENPTDLKSAYIVNETGAKLMGFDNPLGKKFGYSYRPGRIIGVVKDFHFIPMTLKIIPLAIRLDLNRSNYLSIRVDTSDMNRTISSIKQTWSEFSPGFPLDFTFIDDMFNQLYQEDQRQAVSFSYLTCIAIFLACLGLFGLVSYSAEQKTKEIGIRKVFGASVKNVIVLIIRDYLRIIILASLVVSPIVWYAMEKWINNYAYRIEIKAGIFILGIGLSLLMALISSSFQAYKAAVANPVVSLRNE